MKNTRSLQALIISHLPPSLMPLALSMKAAMGEVPMKLPMIEARPSTQKAKVCRGNSFLAFMKPAGLNLSKFPFSAAKWSTSSARPCD